MQMRRGLRAHRGSMSDVYTIMLLLLLQVHAAPSLPVLHLQMSGGATHMPIMWQPVCLAYVPLHSTHVGSTHAQPPTSELQVPLAAWAGVW